MHREMFAAGVGIIIAIVGSAVLLYGTIRIYPPNAARWTAALPQATTTVSFIELAAGSQSKVTTRVNYLITSSGELVRLWKLLGTNDKMPVVDFSKDSVIAVFAGAKPTGGYGIRVTQIEEDGSNRVVSVELDTPGGDCVLAQAMTAPYELALVPKTALPLEHRDETAVRSCK